MQENVQGNSQFIGLGVYTFMNRVVDSKIRIKQILESESEDFGKPQSPRGGGFLLFGEPGSKDRFEKIEIAPVDLP